MTKSEPFTDARLPPGLETRFWPPASWAYGLLQIDDEQIRYGVAAPLGVAKADVIILPAHAESAEMWFETAKALLAEGYTVWILEGAGEGGSSRRTFSRDTAHQDSFETDIRALASFDRLIVRPRGAVAVIASGTAALPALGTVQRGYTPEVLILSGPFDPRTPAWKRPGATDAMTPRRRAATAWALANPDLRMGGVSRGWRRQHEKLQEQLADGPGLAVDVRVRIIAPEETAIDCQSIADCDKTILPATETYPFEANGVRDQWLALVTSVLP